MKRILCSILVVVMLACSLVGCGYSLAEDDMTDYATFSAEDKAKFEALLQEILIKDGDFTSDPEIRKQKVLDSVYAAIAQAVGSTTDKSFDGKADGRDVIYYSYYATAEFDGELSYFYTAKMKSDSAVSIQLGVKYTGDDNKYDENLLAILADHNFTNASYTSSTTGKAVTGETAYVTFTLTEGDKEPQVFTNHPVIIGDAPEKSEDIKTLEEYLDGKTVNSSITKLEIKDAEGNVAKTYSNIKINWIASRRSIGTTAEGDKAYVTYTKQVGDEKAEKFEKQEIVIGKPAAEGTVAANFASFLAGKKMGSPLGDTFETTEDSKTVKYTQIKIDWVASSADALGSFVDTTFDKETLVKDSTGKERDLKDVELKYYIYPVYFKETPEYTAELLVDKVFGEEMTADDVFEILFVNEFAALEDDATEEDRNAIKELAADYKTSDGLTIANMVEKIVKYYEDIEAADEALQNAEDAVINAQNALEDAKADLANNQDESKKEALEAAVKKADEALNGKEGEAENAKTGAIANRDRAKAAHDKIKSDKEKNLKAFLEMKKEGSEENLGTLLQRNYMILNYNYLQKVYNEEIKTNLAKEIYFFLTESITMIDGEFPTEAVESAYDMIYESYESEFYTGYYDSTNKITNYKQYGGNFDKFLIAKVTADIKTVETLKDAKAAIQEKAEESTVDIVKIFLAASVYDQVITDSEYEDFKDELEDYYYYYVLYYKNFDIEEMLGKNNIMTAAQFNKLLDFFLEFEEVKADADADGYIKIDYDYKNTIFGEYKFGDPASEAEDDADDNE